MSVKSYLAAMNLSDNILVIQSHSQKIIYSHETALFLLEFLHYSPRPPSITVPSSYNASKFIKSKCKIYYVKPELLELGRIDLAGGGLVCYDAERTICDIVRSRSRIDKQIFSYALKKYSVHPNANLNRLDEYAKLFSVQKLLNQYLAVLL